MRGPGLYSGYHEDPERTAKAQRGEWFSLGDVGRMDADGYLYLVDRDQAVAAGHVTSRPAPPLETTR